MTIEVRKTEEQMRMGPVPASEIVGKLGQFAIEWQIFSLREEMRQAAGAPNQPRNSISARRSELRILQDQARAAQQLNRAAKEGEPVSVA